MAKLLKLPYYIVKFNLPWKGSALLDKNIKIPTKKITNKIPPTYVPARNIIMLSYAISLAEVINAKYVFYGANQIDFSGYPDCRSNFVKKFQEMVNIGTKTGSENNNIKIVAPLINMPKYKIISLALKLKVPLKFTWSCYSGGEKPCGKCSSCKIRMEGFKKLGIKDPLC